MTDEVSVFLREHGICNDVDFYSIVRDYVFGRRANEETVRERSFIKRCVFFTSNYFFYHNLEVMALLQHP